jgi:hypothetical protein
MPDPSSLQRLKRRKLLQWLRPSRSVLVVVLFAAILDLTTPLGFSGFLMAVGVLWLINAILLKMGIMKPGSILGGETPLGVSLIGLGAIGAGFLFTGTEYRLSLPVFLFLAANGLVFSVGVFMEWRARRERTSRPEAKF